MRTRIRRKEKKEPFTLTEKKKGKEGKTLFHSTADTFSFPEGRRSLLPP